MPTTTPTRSHRILPSFMPVLGALGLLAGCAQHTPQHAGPPAADPAPTVSTPPPSPPDPEPGSVTSDQVPIHKSVPVAVEGFEVKLVSLSCSINRPFTGQGGSGGGLWSLNAQLRVRDALGGRIFRARPARVVEILDDAGRPVADLFEPSDDEAYASGPIFPPAHGPRYSAVVARESRYRMVQAEMRLPYLPRSLRRLSLSVPVDVVQDAVVRELPLEQRDTPVELVPGITATLTMPEVTGQSSAMLVLRVDAASSSRGLPVVNSVELVDPHNPEWSARIECTPRSQDAEGIVLAANFNPSPSGKRSPSALRIHIVTGVKTVELPVELRGIPLAE